MEPQMPFGPWQKLASVKWDEKPLTLYLNEEKILLAVLFDKEGDKVKGILSIMKKPFVVEGNADKIIQSQKRDVTSITKIIGGEKKSFLLVDAQPAFVPYSQKELFAAIRAQHNELESVSKITKDAGSVFGVKITDLVRTEDPAAEEALLGDPFMIFTLGSPSAEGLAKRAALTEIMLGIDSNKEQVEIPTSATKNSLVVAGTRQQRIQALQVLCEGCLLLNKPVFVFDSSKALSGLSLANAEKPDYASFMLPNNPRGFTLNNMVLGSSFFIDLGFVTHGAFVKIMGLDDESSLPLKPVFANSHSLEDLIEKLGKLEESKQITQHSVLKAMRALRVLQQAYPGAFNKDNPKELSAPWNEGTGKVHYFDFSGVDAKLRQLAILFLMKQLDKAPVENSLLVAFEEDAGKLDEATLSQAGEGINLAFQSSSEMDLPAEPTLHLEFVGGQGVLAVQGNAKKKIHVRPTFSKFAGAITQPPIPEKKK
ncbi:MAG: hypothetical protein V1834_00720 [Candidatus Micrarchaeota archaeon]